MLTSESNGSKSAGEKSVRSPGEDATRAATSIDPFEVTEEKTAYGTLVNVPKWAVQFVYAGNVTDVAWCHSGYEHDDFIGYGVRVRINGEEVDVYKHIPEFEVASTLRKHEVRQQLFSEALIAPGSEFFKTEDIANATEKLWKRAGTGEFVGQLNGTTIYTQEVANILGVRDEDVIEAMSEILIPQKRMEFNGMILREWRTKT